jgi:cobalt/nickel transport system permease protein
MHIPDGVLTNTTCVTTLALGGSILAYAYYKSVQSGPSCKTIGIAAAATILLQAVNFPVSETISGHFLGAAFLGWLFAPWAAIAIMGTTLGAQALLLGDGGITAFGANLLALGIWPKEQPKVKTGHFTWPPLPVPPVYRVIWPRQLRLVSL